MKRSPIRRKSAKKSTMVRGEPREPVEFSSSVKERVRLRSGGRCEAAATPSCATKRATGTHFHHRRLRSQGGKGTYENCLLVCSPCHLEIHAHPERAFGEGWMISGLDAAS